MFRTVTILFGHYCWNISDTKMYRWWTTSVSISSPTVFWWKTEISRDDWPINITYSINLRFPTGAHLSHCDFEGLEGKNRRWKLCVSASWQRRQDEAEEKAGTQETYWTGDSVWIYSMSWFLHSRHVRRLLYIQKFVQQIVQNRTK